MVCLHNNTNSISPLSDIILGNGVQSSDSAGAGTAVHDMRDTLPQTERMANVQDMDDECRKT